MSRWSLFAKSWVQTLKAEPDEVQAKIYSENANWSDLLRFTEIILPHRDREGNPSCVTARSNFMKAMLLHFYRVSGIPEVFAV